MKEELNKYLESLSENSYDLNNTSFVNSLVTKQHFYEKLLLLKNQMHTKTAQKMAAQRDAFMRNYLDQFYADAFVVQSFLIFYPSLLF